MLLPSVQNAAIPTFAPAPPPSHSPKPPIKHLLLGHLSTIHSTIQDLQQRGYASAHDWHQLSFTSTHDAIAILTKHPDGPR